MELLSDTTLQIDTTRSVSDIVRSDYRTASVFRKYGINYCCGGMASVTDICKQMKIDYTLLMEDLRAASRIVQIPASLQFNEWKTDFLIDYIINVHHAYLYKIIPDLKTDLGSFVTKHKNQFHQLEEIASVFNYLTALLITHNKHEEAVIFPYIKQLHTAFTKSESYAKSFVKTLRKPLDKINLEHQQIAGFLTRLANLTGNYQFPGKACTTHQVIFSRLQEFHNDIVQHKHLENNILYTRTTEIEKQLLSD